MQIFRNVTILSMLCFAFLASTAGASVSLQVKHIVAASYYHPTDTYLANDTDFSDAGHTLNLVSLSPDVFAVLSQLDDSVVKTCDTEAAKQIIGGAVTWTVFAVHSCK